MRAANVSSGLSCYLLRVAQSALPLYLAGNFSCKYLPPVTCKAVTISATLANRGPGRSTAAYKIQRHPRPEGPWGDVSMAIESEITLSDQTRGTEWEYRVVAVNKAGEGVSSNTVMAVL